jgi:UDP-N-acetylglucosamine--N-acetylmuramyl-(pentapeptide) pyrophosphoryl-undecaprenol N-acetylglucosamine transferase
MSSGRMGEVRVVIAGGGTGGHLYPGIAVAREILRRVPDATVTFAGTVRGLEARVVPREGFALDTIRSAGLKGKSLVSRLRGAAILPQSALDSWRLLTDRQPKVVVGVGGYSSGPVVLMAALRRIPTMVLEQNAVPGLTNRLLAPWVRAAAVTYEQARSYFRGKAIVTGNPVRAEFFAEPAPSVRNGGAPRAPRLLILGGSQGAHAINVAAQGAATTLARKSGGVDVVHQTGERDLASTQAVYASTGLAARVAPFLDGVAAEMHAADLLVCRAGATTLAELAACGRPAILVPFPAATDDHQRKNARVLADAGAAVMLEERDLSGPRLAAEVGRLLDDAAKRQAMAQAMRAFARPNAAALIVDRVLSLAERG